MKPKRITADQLPSIIPDGARVFLAGAAGEPLALTSALAAAAHRLRQVEITSLVVPGVNRCQFLDNVSPKSLRLRSYMGSPEFYRGGRKSADYIPVPLSSIPRLLSSSESFDVGLFQISPPNNDGVCSWGIAVDINPDALANCKIKVAQVNGRLPSARGHWAKVHYETFDYVVWQDSPVIEYPPPAVGAVEKAIAANVATLIPDGATLQVGFGSLARAVLEALTGKRDLGIHSGMITDTMVDLVKDRVITGSRKVIDPGLVVATMALGTQKVREFINTSAASLRPVAYTHDPTVLNRHRRFFAINSGLQVDLTGQVNAEALDGKQISGFGGQPDFMAAAARCADGLAILALPAVNRRTNQSNIVSFLPETAPVTTIRGCVDVVVTEYGVAMLRGRTLSERAAAIAAVAHPDLRSRLLASI